MYGAPGEECCACSGEPCNDPDPVSCVYVYVCVCVGGGGGAWGGVETRGRRGVVMVKAGVVGGRGGSKEVVVLSDTGLTQLYGDLSKSAVPVLVNPTTTLIMCVCVCGGGGGV